MTLAFRLSGAARPLAGPARLFGVLALALSAALIFGRPAEAIVINIDSGSVGDSFIDISFALLPLTHHLGLALPGPSVGPDRRPRRELELTAMSKRDAESGCDHGAI